MPFVPFDNELEDVQPGSGFVALDDNDPTLAGRALDRATSEFAIMGRDLYAGARKWHAGLMHETANAFMLLDRGAQILSDHTGIPKPEAMRRVEQYYRSEAQKGYAEAERVGGKGFWSKATQTIGSLPGSVAEAGAAALTAGPILGFGGLGALSAADRGPQAALVEGAKGAAIGAIFGGTPALGRLERGAAIGTAAAGLEATTGAKPEDIALSGLTMGALAGLAGGRGMRLQDRKLLDKAAKMRGKLAKAEDAEPIRLRQSGEETEPIKDVEVKTAEKPIVEVTPRTQQAATEFLGRDYSDLEVPDKAINLNLKRIEGTDDFKKAIAELTDIYSEEINVARRGIVTHEQSNRAAEDLGLTLDQFLSHRKGQALNDAEMQAYRKMNASILTEWKRLADLSKRGKLDEQGEAEFVRMTALAQGSLESTLGATAEAGRTLSVLRQKVGPSTRQMREMREMIRDFQMGGKKNVKEFAEMVADVDNAQGLAKFALDSKKATTSDKLIEIWINALLSGPQTHAVNFLSNGMVAFYTVPETYLAGAIDTGRNLYSRARGRGRIEDRVYMREGTERLLGIAQGAKDGLILGWKVFWGGEGFDPTTKLESMKYRSIKGPFGEFIRIPGRALVSADEFFKSIARRQELNALGVRDGINQGLSGRALAQHIRDFVQNPPEAAAEAAVKSARYQTFTQQLGERGQGIQRGLSGPVGRVLAPFIRTPTNIFKFSLERSPFSVVLSEVRADLKAGGARRSTAMARIAFSSAVSAWVASEAASGNITGSGPSDSELRATWYLTNRPYSIRIPSSVATAIEQKTGYPIGERIEQTGDVWVSFSRLEPLGTILGVAADFAEISGQIEEKGSDELASKISIAVSRNITNKTFISGLSGVALMLSDPDRYGPRWYQRLAGTIVPTGLAQVARTQDPILREVQSAMDQIKSRLPGYSKDLKPRLNVWGEPIFLDGGLGPDLISPLYSNRLEPDKASEEAWRLRIEFSKPQRKIGNVELTEDEYYQLRQLTGQVAKRSIDLLVNTQYYDAMPDAMKREYISKDYQTARDIARTVIGSRISAQRKGEAEMERLAPLVEALQELRARPLRGTP